MTFMESMEYWHWLIFGVVLLGLEALVFGAVFLWFGIAAILVGLVNLINPDAPWSYLVLTWAVISVLMAFGWQHHKKHCKFGKDEKSTMNRRGEQYVGRHFTLAKDVVNGAGELHVDDTRWKIVSNQDFAAGVKVKVIAVEGTSLRVEEYIS